MKKILVFSSISFFLFGILAIAGAADLSGCWEVEIEGITSQGVPETENNHIWIIQEDNDLFWGWVCNDPNPAEQGMHFSGAIDGKDVYITHWDSFTKARLKKKGKRFKGINQAVDIDDREGKTSFGTANRVDDVDCGICEPYSE